MTQEEATKVLNGYMGGKIDPESTELYQAIELVVDILESQPPLPSNLDEAAEEYGRNTFINECMENGVCDDHDLSDAFKAGAEWQKEQDEKEQADLFTIVALDAAQRAKEQMMKDSVEGLFWNTPFPTICLDDCKDYNFKDNQRVRIIIVKEDER